MVLYLCLAKCDRPFRRSTKQAKIRSTNLFSGSSTKSSSYKRKNIEIVKMFISCAIENKECVNSAHTNLYQTLIKCEWWLQRIRCHSFLDYIENSLAHFSIHNYSFRSHPYVIDPKVCSNPPYIDWFQYNLIYQQEG